ncbi:UNVERIFIED_CONTAM: hypothetical protein NCL1_27742 [Trichonephila clavipes]
MSLRWDYSTLVTSWKTISSSLDIIQEPCFPFKTPTSTKIILDLLEPCTKKEPKGTIKRKDMNTIIGLMRPPLVIAYTDDNTTSKHVCAGQISSNFTCELITIRKALDIYLTRTNIADSDGIIVLSDCRSALEAIKEGKMGLTQEINSLLFSIGALGKSCILQGIPAYVDIEGSEMADSLEPLTSYTMVFDANAVAKQKLCSNPRKNLSLSELNYS